MDKKEPSTSANPGNKAREKANNDGYVNLMNANRPTLYVSVYNRAENYENPTTQEDQQFNKPLPRRNKSHLNAESSNSFSCKIFGELLDEVGKACSSAARKFNDVEKSGDTFHLGKNYSTSINDKDVDGQINIIITEMLNGNFNEYKAELNELVKVAVKNKIKMSPVDLVKRARKHKSENKIYKAVTEFNLVSKLSLLLKRVELLHINANQHAVAGMVSCIESLIDGDNCDDGGVVYFDQTDVCNSVIIPAIREAIEDLNKVKVHPKDEPELQKNIAWCYKALGFALHQMEMYKEAAEELSKGVGVLEEEYKQKSKSKKIYGLLLSSIGDSYRKQKMYDIALSYYERATVVYHALASDEWATEKEKARIIDVTESILDLCKGHIAVDTLRNDVDKIVTEAAAVVELIKKPETRKESEKHFEIMSKFVEKFYDTYMWQQLFKKGKVIKREGEYYTAIVLFRLVSKALKGSKQILKVPVGKVQHSVGKITEISREIDDNEFKQNYIIPSLREIVDDLYHMPNADYAYCLENIAWCHNCIGNVFSQIELYDESIKEYAKGLALMDTAELVTTAPKCRIFGLLKGLTGNAYSQMKRHATAGKWYKESLELLTTSEDWESKMEKESTIQATHSNIRVSNLLKSDHTNLIGDQDFDAAVKACVANAEANSFDEFQAKLIDIWETAQKLDDSENVVQSIMESGSKLIEEEKYMPGMCVHLSIVVSFTTSKFMEPNLSVVTSSFREITKTVSFIIETDENRISVIKNCVIAIMQSAIIDFETSDDANETNESYIWCQYYLAQCLLKIEEYQQALLISESALENLKKYFPSSYNSTAVMSQLALQLSLLHGKVGNNDEATKWTQNAIEVLGSSTESMSRTRTTSENKTLLSDNLESLQELQSELEAQLRGLLSSGSQDCPVM